MCEGESDIFNGESWGDENRRGRSISVKKIFRWYLHNWTKYDTPIFIRILMITYIYMFYMNSVMIMHTQRIEI